jgi:hypothetical protein
MEEHLEVYLKYRGQDFHCIYKPNLGYYPQK